MVKLEDPLLLGLDLGISTAKAALFDVRGSCLGSQTGEYLILPNGEKVETDPDTYWKPIAGSIRKLLQSWGGQPAQIIAVAVASHTETVIPLDGHGQPVRKALVWMDTRSQPEALELERTVGLARVLAISGQPEINPIWPLTKFRWMSKNEPREFARTAKFLLPEDYIIYRLSGQMVAEHTMWSSSLALDIRAKDWSDAMLSFAGVRRDQLPELCAPGTVVGQIGEDCSRETGLNQKTLVVAGGIDQVCGAIGAGNIAAGIVTESTGSVLALLATISEPVLNIDPRIPCHIHALPNMYCLLPWNPSGGLVLKWFRDNILAAVGEFASYERLTAEAEQILPGCDGLAMLPHLNGALFPEYDAKARAVFFGATLTHTRAHFVRAIMEAVAFMIRRDLEGLRRLGVDAHEIRVLGGGAKSRLWSQIKADVCGVRVVVPSQTESAALGAALLAAVGAGIHRDIPEAAQEMTSARDVVHPFSRRDVYDVAYGLYVELYDSTHRLFESCDKIRRLANTSEPRRCNGHSAEAESIQCPEKDA
jgi:xylulokinase